MDYKRRTAAVREEMERRQLDGILIPADANLEYLTSIPRLGCWNTKQRQNSSDFTCMLMTAKETIVFLPSLTYLVCMAKLNGRTVDARFAVYQDGDLEGRALSQELKLLHLEGKTLGAVQDLSAPLLLKLQGMHNIQFKDASDILADLRSVKDEEELEIMRQASRMTDQIYYDLISEIHLGDRVTDLELEIERLILKHGGSCSSFPGELNNHGPKAGHMVGYSHDTIEKGYVLGLDFGLVYQGYCTDFGRTVFIGEPSKEHQTIHEAVMKAQQAAFDRFGDGKSSCESVHLAAQQVLDQAGYGRQFIHKLGHGVGMDVHETPFLCFGEKRLLKKGMAFAVEPSVFLPRSCFIRSEDIAVVTENGYEQLSQIPHDIKVICD